MIPLPDLDTYPVMEWLQFKWLLDRGVPTDILARLSPIHVARGVTAADGCFEDDPGGQPFLAFPEAEDCVFWQPRTGELATWNGRSFALGEEAIYNAGTFAFDCNLNLWPDPLYWLRSKCDGIVIVDWPRAFDRLRDCPRIAVHESLLASYRKHMRPAHLPELFVIPCHERAAA